ncbi:MAG: hypothetical protein QM820_47425 [Minicystis sp.]
MKMPSLLALLAALACAVPASAAVPEPPETSARARCLADRLDAIDAVAASLGRTSELIRENLRDPPDPVPRLLTMIGSVAYDVRARVLHRGITSPAELEGRLVYSSAGLDQLRDHVTDLIHHLDRLGQPGPSQAAAEMAQEIEAVRKLIPADEPPRGCPVVASSGP